jgi:hypothetical protein
MAAQTARAETRGAKCGRARESAAPIPLEVLRRLILERASAKGMRDQGRKGEYIWWRCYRKENCITQEKSASG